MWGKLQQWYMTYTESKSEAINNLVRTHTIASKYPINVHVYIPLIRQLF